MIEKYVKNTVIYNEFTQEENKNFFDLSRQKFIHNIDSLYYTVKIKDEHWDNYLELVSLLDRYKEQCYSNREKIIVSDIGDDYVMRGIGSSPYAFDVDKTNCYMMFFIKSKMTNTPEVVIQIRSQFLWIEGEYEAVEKSLEDIESILSSFNIEIEEVKENRIDYAYHTNYIQDPLNFFKEENLNAMQVSRFKRASKEYFFNGEDSVECDYITFGRKKSNNIFFRIYNKTKEFIEMGYKQFFNRIWLDNKLINQYDFYCYEKAFILQSYRYLDIARLEFYKEFGKDDIYKSSIDKLLNSKDRDYFAIKKLADKLTPRITLVMNIEFETRRKFYYSLDDSVNQLLKVYSDCKDYAKKLYVKLDNKQLFTNLLTNDVIRFIDMKDTHTRKKNKSTAQWWTRLQQCKVNKRNCKIKDVELVRKYQRDLDIEITKKRLVNNISTYSLYLGKDLESTCLEDTLDFICTLNENDIENSIKYKKKKFALLKNRLSEVQINTDSEKRSYSLLDNVTGELIEN